MSRTFRNALLAVLAVLFILYTAATIHVAHVSVEMDEFQKEYEANRDRLARLRILDVLRKMQEGVNTSVSKALAEVPGRKTRCKTGRDYTLYRGPPPSHTFRKLYVLDGPLPEEIGARLETRLTEATDPGRYFACDFRSLNHRGRLDGGVEEEVDVPGDRRERGQFWYAARRIRVEPEAGEVRVGVFLASGRLTPEKAQELADDALFDTEETEETATGDAAETGSN